MQTFKEYKEETDNKILDFMKKHPDIYGNMTIEEFLEYHEKKRQLELDAAFEDGYEGGN